MSRRLLATAALLAGLAACSPPADPLAGITLEEQTSGVTSSLRGLAVVNDDVVWIGAPAGQVLRTVDGGAHWDVLTIDAAEGADLRSAHGFSADRALFFTAGQPARLFLTEDGGASFRTVWDDPTGNAFFDSLAFWNSEIGIAFSDPIPGGFLVLGTQDAGESWTRIPGLPEPLEGEAGFAASDSSIATAPNGCAWIGTGGGETARVLRTCEFGAEWDFVDTPMAAGTPGSGIFALAYTGEKLIAAGGNYEQADATDGNLAWSDDGGTSWDLPIAAPAGYRSDVAVLPLGDNSLIATGPNGTDISRNGGEIWTPWPDLPGHHAIAFSPSGRTGWAVGSDGRITRITLPPRN